MAEGKAAVLLDVPPALHRPAVNFWPLQRRREAAP